MCLIVVVWPGKLTGSSAASGVDALEKIGQKSRYEHLIKAGSQLDPTYLDFVGHLPGTGFRELDRGY